MNRRVLLICLIAACGVFALSKSVQAGFGISPPYVKPTNPIFPGSHYEQRITLLRSTAEDDLVAEVVINAPEIQDWISIKQGSEFDFPKGRVRVPMVVMVDIPQNAEIGDYKGHLNIRIRPKDDSRSSGVAIALGARVDIELTVTNEELLEFVVRTTEIPTFETLGKPWNWPIFSWFLYRINLLMKIENTGNTPIAPSKVQLDVWDIGEKDLLESSIDKSIKKVEPFKTKTVTADFKTNLPPGQYWGKIKVFKGNEIVLKNELTFTILEHGELEGGSDLGFKPWIIVGVYLFIILVIIVLLIWVKIWLQLWRLLLLLTWPLRAGSKQTKSWFRRFKIKFFRWLHKKSAKYQNIDDRKDRDKTNSKTG